MIDTINSLFHFSLLQKIAVGIDHDIFYFFQSLFSLTVLIIVLAFVSPLDFLINRKFDLNCSCFKFENLIFTL